MAGKTIPLSVRISHDDAEFIAGLKIDGAVTPSDKIRAIITDARTREQHSQDYNGNLKLAKDLFAPTLEQVQSEENINNQHSELLITFSDWLAESVAFFASSYNSTGKKVNLKNIEAGVTKRVFRLMDFVLRMGVTKNAPCYDKKVISDNIEPMLELMEIVNQNIKKEK